MRHAALALAVVGICLSTSQVYAGVGVGQELPCEDSLIAYLDSNSNLTTFAKFAKVFASTGFKPNPRNGFTVFAPTEDAWARTIASIGTVLDASPATNNSSAPAPSDDASVQYGLTARQLDILLSVCIYHYTLAELISPVKALAANNVQSALGDFLGFNISLYFRQSLDDQIQVEGIPFANRAPLNDPITVCNTSVYQIDTVLRPARQLTDIPGYSEIVASQQPGGPPVADEGAFQLPLPPDSEGISVTATGEGKDENADSNINGDPGGVSGDARGAAASEPAPAPLAASPSSGPPFTWQACALAAAALLALPVMS